MEQSDVRVRPSGSEGRSQQSVQAIGDTDSRYSGRSRRSIFVLLVDPSADIEVSDAQRKQLCTVSMSRLSGSDVLSFSPYARSR